MNCVLRHMRIQDVLPSRGIENTTPENPLGRSPVVFTCAAVNTQTGFAN